MSNRGFRGGSTARGGRGGGDFRGRGRGGFQHRDAGPPDTVLEMGTFVHAVEDEMLCSSLLVDKVPKFNSAIYLQNKSVIGKIDEILGPINEVYFSVKMGEGMVASSFKKGDKVYIGGDQLLPLDRFLPKPKTAGKVENVERGRGGGGRGGRGGGGDRGRGRGMGRGMSRGGAGAGGRGRGFGGSGDFRGRGGRGGFSRGGGGGRGRGRGY